MNTYKKLESTAQKLFCVCSDRDGGNTVIYLKSLIFHPIREIVKGEKGLPFAFASYHPNSFPSFVTRLDLYSGKWKRPFHPRTDRQSRRGSDLAWLGLSRVLRTAYCVLHYHRKRRKQGQKIDGCFTTDGQAYQSPLKLSIRKYLLHNNIIELNYVCYK